MKRINTVIAIVTILISISGCGSQKDNSQSLSQQTEVQVQEEVSSVEPEEEQKEYFVEYVFESKELQGSTVEQKTEQKAYVYLPPSYYDSEKTYPVVYFLHGYSETPQSFIQLAIPEFDEEFNNGAKEYIIVSVSGINKLRGAFYTNSPISGNWENYVVKEVVPLIDENYRTIRDSESRGICGFSMGGYGAYNIAFKYPDVFGAMLTMSPGLIADGDFASAFDSWTGDDNFKIAYAQAFSPNQDVAEVYGNIPTLSGTPEDNAIIEEWESGYGNINQKVDDYVALNKPLKAIKIIYGTNDTYPWIPKGCEFLSDVLTERNIEHSAVGLDYGHYIPPSAVKDFMIPFFNENLIY